MKLITFSELKQTKGIPYTRVHLSRLVQHGKFPQPIKLSENRIAWDEEEIDAHLASLAARRTIAKAA